MGAFAVLVGNVIPKYNETILIFQFCLFDGKKVLFVAEKVAALEIVENRLSMADVGRE
jgi:hypothetical protein